MRLPLIALLPLAGCFVAPSSHVTTRHVGFEPSSEVRKGLARGLTLKTTVVHGQAVISAIRTRDCHREVFEVVEVTERRGLRMAVPEDPRAGVFGFFLAPV